MKKLFRLFLSLGFLLLSYQVNAQGYLHAEGKYIYDGAGNEVILKGIGTGNWMIQEGYMMGTTDVAGTQHEIRNKLIATIGEEKTDSFYTVWLDSYFSRADADSMSSWGFNSLRVAMHYKWLTLPIEDEPVAGENTWLEEGFVRLDSLLKRCGDNQMYLILDLHGAPGGQGKNADISDYDPTKLSLWESPANKAKTIALWRKLAERYADEPWIGGYDLINETNWPLGNNSQLKDLMVNITNAIREVDQHHLIFVEGNDFANNFSGLTPPWDNNMAYSFHKYWNNYDQGSLSFVLPLRDTYNVPLWLGESGENSNVWYTGTIELCEKNKIGWSWWPVKKSGINNVFNVETNSDYSKLIDYWKGTAPKPTEDAAFQAVLTFARNHKIENCTVQRDVIDAMMRQPQTLETIPYKTFHIGEPVFATDYNMGRNGYAYFDVDTANLGGAFVPWNAGWTYRNDGVDIEPCLDSQMKNGYNVGWTSTGEWLEYTIDVDSSAAYTLSFRSTSGSSGSKVHMEVNGSPVSPIVTLPTTGGWQSWQTTSITGVALTKGVQKIRLMIDRGGSNLNYFLLSDPVSLDDLKFEHIFAESSVDGRSITLSLNKEITSAIENVSLSDFTVNLNSKPLDITAVGISETDPNAVVLNLADTLYYGGAITLTYSGSSIMHESQVLEGFSDYPVVNNLPVRFNIPGRIEAENYTFNNGMVPEECSDAGGGIDLGYASNGKFLDYNVYVAKTKYYTINFRLAALNAGGKISVRTGTGTGFKEAGQLSVKATGGWQTWGTQQLTVKLDSGRYTLRLYILSGEFNLNWFQLFAASTVGINTEKVSDPAIYPNPATDYIIVAIPSESNNISEISICNLLGQKVLSQQVTKGNLNVRIPVNDLKKGMYFVILGNQNHSIYTSKLLIE
ncbi:MAG: carbohydrate-binding protein [Bacteroidales bacterium]|nr:carbohydrate-binding protein [Bacteroidales bacterium]